jgi:hypothetical protein
MLAHPRSTVPAPHDGRAPAAAAGAVAGSVPTLRQILARYRGQGTAAGRLAGAAPAPETVQSPPVPQLKSLRSLFLDSTGAPAPAPAARDDAGTRPAPPRRR